MADLGSIDILLAEDNPADAEMTMRALRKHNLANQLHWVKDGVEALDFLECTGAYAGRDAKSPRLVLLDLKMPRVDGIQVLRRIKAHERLRGIPVVMMTSSHEDRDMVESYRLGVNSYVVKPVEFEAFLKAVADLGLYWMLINRTP
jgi:two-component system, response regulator